MGQVERRFADRGGTPMTTLCPQPVGLFSAAHAAGRGANDKVFGQVEEPPVEERPADQALAQRAGGQTSCI